MIFGFFSRWKKAGKATGVTGGAGKLCAFDKDGNVVSAGVTAEEVGGKLYRHVIRLYTTNVDTTSGPVFRIFTTVYSKRSTSYTVADFMALLPDNADGSWFSATGYATTPLFDSNMYSVFALDIATNNNLEIHANLRDGSNPDFYFNVSPEDVAISDYPFEV